MMGIGTFRAMLGRGRHGALIAAIIAVALILGLSAHCKKTPIPNAETSEFASADNELSARIKQLVRGLEYPDEVAEDFTRMALDWKDELGRPLLIGWKENLAKAHQDYQEGKMSRNRVAKIEEDVLEELCKKIKKQFSPQKLAFELSDVIENRQVDCIGCSQLTYIIGNAVGLSVRPIEVLDLAISLEGDAQAGHMACITDLSDGRSVMADVSFFETRSRAFDLEDHFVKVGNYWELRDKLNRLLIHRRIRLLGRKGLIAAICNSRGHVYRSKGEHGQAILEYSKAIEIDPGFARAYNNRGNRFGDKGEYDRAILDYTKAIEIDPRSAKAYNNRGTVYADTHTRDRAILDFTKAVEIAPRFATAYNNRGAVYSAKDEYDRAIQDYDKAIEMNPKYAEAYYNRGLTYIDKGEFDRAISDFTKAIEVNPKFDNAYVNRGDCYYKKGDYDRAVLDSTQAIEINPRNAYAYNNRGVAYADKGEHDRAILDYEKAIETDPEYAVAYLNRGEVYAELGKAEEAKKDLLKAIKFDPELKESAKKVSEQHKLDLKLD